MTLLIDQFGPTGLRAEARYVPSFGDSELTISSGSFRYSPIHPTGAPAPSR